LHGGVLPLISRTEDLGCLARNLILLAEHFDSGKPDQAECRSRPELNQDGETLCVYPLPEQDHQDSRQFSVGSFD